MTKNELEQKMIREIVVDVVAQCLDALKTLPDHPHALTTCVGNIIGNVAMQSVLRNKDERAGGEIMAAIVTIAFNSADAYLKERGLDRDLFMAAYLHCRTQFAAQAHNGTLEKIERKNHEEEDNSN
jgi:hypothetical protein